jgi:uncharacterized protein YukE
VDDRGGVDGGHCQGGRVSSTPAPPAGVRGDPDTLDDLALACRRTAGALRNDADRVRRTDVGAWSGEAAQAFGRSVRGLPRDLSLAADSYDTVAGALRSYAADLRDLARAARRAEADQAEVAGLLRAEEHRLVGGVDAGAEAARERRMSAYEEQGAAIRRRLAALGGEAELSAGTATARVRSVCDAPQAPPGLFERLADGVGDWVAEHAQVLGEVSLVLKGVAAVAGVLSLVPGLAAVAVPIAVAAGVLALAIDAALASRGRASWAAVGVDAALTALPVARPAGVAVREVRTRLGTVVVYRVEGTPNSRVVIDADHNVRFTSRSTVYLNFGDKRRAHAYYEQKLADGLPGVQLKAFRVPRGVHRQLSLRAVDEHLARAFRDRPIRVDVTKAREQLGLRRHDVGELQRHILPGSGKVLR